MIKNRINGNLLLAAGLAFGLSVGCSDVDQVTKKSKTSEEGEDLTGLFAAPTGDNGYGYYEFDRGYTYGSFNSDSMYDTLSESKVPAAHKRVTGDCTTMDFGRIFTDSAAKGVLTKIMTHANRVPTACVVQALKNRQSINSWTDAQLEDEAVRNGVVLLPIDETQVDPGAERLIYSSNVVRFKSQTGGDFVTASCMTCHSFEGVMEYGGCSTIVKRYGPYGGAVGKNVSYGFDLINEGAELAKNGGCGDLTLEERVAAARLLDTMDRTAGDGAQIGTAHQQANYLSKSSYKSASHASTLAHMAVGGLMRTKDYDMQCNPYEDDDCGYAGQRNPPSYNETMTSRHPNHLFGTATKDPFKDNRNALMARTQNDDFGNPGKHFQFRPAASMYAPSAHGFMQAKVFSGGYGCVDLKKNQRGCSEESFAMILTLPLSSNWVVGDLTAQTKSDLNLPADTTGETGHVFLDADVAYNNSKTLHNYVNSKMGPKALPGIAMLGGITVDKIKDGIVAANQKCTTCHADSSQNMAGRMMNYFNTSTGKISLPAPSHHVVDAAINLSNNEYYGGLARSFDSTGEGNFVKYTAVNEWYKKNTEYGGFLDMVYQAPDKDTEIAAATWIGAFPSSLYGLCWVNLDYMFKFLDEGARQPDLIAINPDLIWDPATGGYKIKEVVKNYSRAEHDRLNAQYGESYVWARPMFKECARTASVKTYANTFHSVFATLTEAEIAGLKAVMMIAGAESTPDVPVGDGTKITVKLTAAMMGGHACGYGGPNDSSNEDKDGDGICPEAGDDGYDGGYSGGSGGGYDSGGGGSTPPPGDPYGGGGMPPGY